MDNILWVQNKYSGKASTFFYRKRKINENGKESLKITRFLTETEFDSIYESKSGTIKEIARDEDGYLIAGLLLNKEENGRRIPFTGYANGDADDVLKYLNGTLNSNSMSISDEDIALIKNTINRDKNSNKTILIAGIAIISLIAIYIYTHGKS